MKLLPMDISNREFKRSMRGYNVEEVDEFVYEISESYETLYAENSKLKEEIERIRKELNHYGKLEDTIQKTLLLAENTAKDVRENSQKEANIIVRKANESAQSIIDKAHKDIIGINNDYEKTKNDYIMFRNKFKLFMSSIMSSFEECEKDFAKNYNIVEEVQELELRAKPLDNSAIGTGYNMAGLEDDMANIRTFEIK